MAKRAKQTKRGAAGAAVSEEAVQRIAEKWQRLLRLCDWDVVVEVVGRSDMEDPAHLGECHTDPLEREAVIRVVRLEEMPPEMRSAAALENVVVHELCHLWMRDAEQCVDTEEYVVRRVSKALCALGQGRV